MNLNIIAVTTKTRRFYWESYLYLHSLRMNGLSHLTHLLVFCPHVLLPGGYEGWDRLVKDFPEVNIEFYYDNDNFERVYNSFGYIPLMRPYCLSRYFDVHPEFEKEAFFYTDTDVLITKPIDFKKYLHNKVCYVSEAGSYTDHDYFDSKRRLDKDGNPEFMKPEKYQEGLKRDFLNEFASICGINRHTVEFNKGKSGAAQYLLKNINGDFWRDVMSSCMELKTAMDNINREFMQSSDKGFQAWCADIHAVVWQLWKRGIKTECPKEFDFAWATDNIKRWEETSIFHNAGAVSETNGDGAPLFHKGAYRYVSEQTSPFDEPDKLQEIIDNPLSSQLSTSLYSKALLNTKNIYGL